MQKGENSMTRVLHEYRSELLLCALIAEIVISPLADSHPFFGGLLAASVLLMLVIGAQYIVHNKVVQLVGFPLAGIWIIARGLEAFGNQHRFYTHLAPIAGLGLSCEVLWALLSRFRTLHIVTRNLISEAMINYLVIAIAFSQLYWVLNHFIDHPFNREIPRHETSSLLYFSMITLTSVGYGGIVPVNPYVRFVAALESMTGIFYLAVIVARIVASYRPRHAERQPAS
jgi:Ion channel